MTVPHGRARHPRRLGPGRRTVRGQRDLARRHAGVRRAVGRRIPHTQLTAKGEAVGLPEGQMGNSEVGHLNLGAGAIVPQDLARIDEAVEDGSLADNETLPRGDEGRAAGPPDRARLRRRRALVRAPPAGADRAWPRAGRRGPRRPRVHRRPRHAAHRRARSPSPGSRLARAGSARVGSVIGRYFAMDRDKRWDRTREGDRPARRRRGRAPRRQRRGGGQGGVRARRDRRVHRADDRRRRGADPARATR